MSDNLRVAVFFGGHNLPPLVEIGLIDLSKSGGAMASGSTTTKMLLSNYPKIDRLSIMLLICTVM